MSENISQPPLMSRGMKAVLISQFLSAFADNALLFAILAQFKSALYPEWSQPVLQMVFVLAFILLAPFVGQFADRNPKGRVMLSGNLLKFVGAFLICVGSDPFLGYALVGIGAAVYSPAKYGILGELTDGERLVKANGLMEASTIAAILLGSVIGGLLSDWSIVFALGVCAAMYGLAVFVNLGIPKLSAAQIGRGWNIKKMFIQFLEATRTLWADKESRFSLVGTSMFWGAGVTLRFLLVQWVPIALGMTDNTTPTVLNAMVAIGIVVGAGLAAKFVTLKTVRRCMPAGILIGLGVVYFSLQTSIIPSYLILIIIGVFGGFFVVPLNALLQDKGKHSVGAGNAIAVQNLGENTAMLLMLGLFSLVTSIGVSVVAIGIGFGAIFALAIGGLWLWDCTRKKS
ncbi:MULTISPECIES: lysophospholipid transporter LplT [Proteus]|uniref:lysophospholipid transporter LplT n=1 Tax=Proteus TaxID=583 RepID=UPI000BFBF384|nr:MULTISPECIES: lysophospholipid transporter LplT [Proteus]ATN01453.1 lysophospholipid transporter LplT [Proteus vulgaris]MBG2837956.1 lysophospholipid transporter LplT [Proteus terrae subsp. cibarius]MBG2867721.1 lysophospholipid transporter LplT [Proteus terrae subsp. cibarius]MBJ2110144.1 lysophospholipid transporter LplT [Proteus terrae]MBJ2134072.1 lysophospholipid transporter LplT [Proteus terrae]